MENKILRIAAVATSLVLIGLIFWFFKSIVVYILVSAVLSIIGSPLVKFLNSIHIGKIRVPNGVSAAIVLVAFWGVIFLFFRIFIPVIAYEAQELANIDVDKVGQSLEEPIMNLQRMLGNSATMGETIDLKSYVSEKIVSIVSVSQISNIFSSVAGVMGDIFIAFFAISFITYFFLRETHLFGQSILLLTPEKYVENVRNIIISVKRLLIRYFVGIIGEVFLVMILVTTGLTLVGLEFQHALIIGLIAGILNVIPYVGPVIGTIFGITIGIANNLDMSFYSELLPLIIYMAIVFITVQVIDNVLFQPLIYSNSVHAHPLEIFLVIMLAGSIAGIKGMILAIPGYTVIRVVAREFFYKLRVVKKLTEKM